MILIILYHVTLESPLIFTKSPVGEKGRAQIQLSFVQFISSLFNYHCFIGMYISTYIYIYIILYIYIFLQELSQSCQLFTNLSTKPQIPSGGMWFQIVCKEEISFLRCSNLRPRLPAAKYTCCWIDLYWLEMVQETGNKIHAKKAIRDVPKCWVFQFQWFKHVRTHLKNVI